MTVAGKPVDLSPTEYRALEYLSHRPRSVISKQVLLEHLYDYNWEHHSNVIEAHISNLRRKLNRRGEDAVDRDSARARLSPAGGTRRKGSGMKQYSLRRRLIAMVLAVECALTVSISGTILFYIWRDHVYSFDQMVRGRADSLLGAVHDAENAADDVTITPQALDLPAGDAWMARDAGGRVLAQSANWDAAAEKLLASAKGPRDVTIAGRPSGA